MYATHFSGFSNNASWIIDSGALDHMTFNLNCLVNVRKKKYGISGVKLSSGSSAYVRHIGDFVLGIGHILIDVLYIPEFKFNIVSVSKLC